MTHPPRDAGLPPGFDEEDPYEGVDLADFPEWWRRNVELFRKYGLRPYRPARLADGAVVPTTIDRLKAEFGVRVHLRAVDPGRQHEWGIWVDGVHVRTVSRERKGEWYTQYDITSDELAATIRKAVQQ